MDIATVGAGLRGFMTALFLEQQEFAARLPGVTPELRPLGIGAVLEPSGTKEFEELGLRERLEEISLDATKQSIPALLKCSQDVSAHKQLVAAARL